MTIQILTNETIGKIAAGEVVERPASVVKELLENSLDAGARRISIAIRGGGIDQIEITDDGCGIPASELALAIQRHATSKLQSFADLDRLQTLGFRGEALPSIAAVSQLSIRTKTEDARSASLLEVEFGAPRAIESTGAPQGTTVVVNDLFLNIPARRKFLRQASTEAGNISRIVSAYAAAYPAIQFTLFSEGRRVLGTDGAGDLIGAVAGSLGADAGNAAIPLEQLDDDAAVPGVTVRGWVGAPAVNRSHRQQMLLFVNGRWIQNRQLTFAIEEAYHSLLMVGRHPVTLILIAVDAAAVDVNVHPTKSEVKFADERAVFRAVQRAVHSALARAPRDELPRIGFAPLPERPYERQTAFATNGIEVQRDHLALPPDEPKLPQITPRSLPVLRVLGQVSGTYIIAEGPEGMYLIDQHAAHERVMYEKIQSQMQSTGVDRQPLLDPMLVELTPEESAVFERSQPELAEIGFEVEPFGDGTVVIRAVPAIVTGVDIRERFRLILSELASGGVGTSWLDSVAISAACHTSIRAGQQLSLQEMRELVSQLERTRHPRACGHGRPTMLLMSQSDLEKQFSRR
jgi:DNA mismatch repair protein MutL